MRYRVTHRTEYLYGEPVGLCRNQACLLPRDTLQQHCSSSRLKIAPKASDLRERRDFFGNRICHFAVQHPHEQLQVTAISEVSIAASAPLAVMMDRSPWEDIRRRLADLTDLADRETLEALPYRYDSPLVQSQEQLAAYALPSFPAGRPLVEALNELMQRINHDFVYDPGFTSIATPLNDVLATRRGVCQDFAHLGIGCLRSLGLAARYISGYIETLPPPGQERLIGADASHAWFSVYCGEVGWVDFDPTNNQLPGEQHITVAWGRDFSDVSPLKGIALGGGKHRVQVAVDVLRLPAEES